MRTTYAANCFNERSLAQNAYNYANTISIGGTITGNAAAGNVSANAVGYMGMPQNNLTSNYEITLADQGKHLYYNVSSNNVLLFQQLQMWHSLLVQQLLSYPEHLQVQM
jgi:hypothetical protein